MLISSQVDLAKQMNVPAVAICLKVAYVVCIQRVRERTNHEDGIQGDNAKSTAVVNTHFGQQLTSLSQDDLSKEGFEHTCIYQSTKKSPLAPQCIAADILNHFGFPLKPTWDKRVDSTGGLCYGTPSMQETTPIRPSVSPVPRINLDAWKLLSSKFGAASPSVGCDLNSSASFHSNCAESDNSGESGDNKDDDVHVEDVFSFGHDANPTNLVDRLQTQAFISLPAHAPAPGAVAAPAFLFPRAPVAALTHRDSAAEKTLCDHAFRMMSEVPTLASSPERPIEISALIAQLEADKVNTRLYGKRGLKAWSILSDDSRFVVTSRPASDARDIVGVIYLAAAGAASEGPAITPSPAPASQRSRVEDRGRGRGKLGAAARGGN
jgi:hypothetical protein